MSENDQSFSEASSALSDRLIFLRNKHFGPRGKSRFASKLGLPVSTYSTYEAGRNPPPEILAKICDITGCDLRWLITGSPGNSANIHPEISEILKRMESILASQPKAKQAVLAMMDLLTVPSMVQVEDKTTVIPILGRAAAGIPAFWESGEEEYHHLAARVRMMRPEEIQKRVLTRLNDHVLMKEPGQIEIVQFSNPVIEGDCQIDGVILASKVQTVGKLFAVTLVGESMEPQLKSGDLVIIDSGIPAEEGKVCLAELCNRMGAVCKVFFPENEQIRLTSLNEKYEPILVRRNEIKWAFKVISVIKQ